MRHETTLDEGNKARNANGVRHVGQALSLSPYQQKICGLVAQGLSNRDIAAELNSSVLSVKSALHSIFDKLGVWNRVELARRCAEHLGPEARVSAQQKLEAQRLRALDVIQRDPQTCRELDDVVSLLATLCKTPIALVSIVEERRLWFQAETGMGVREVARKASFCDHCTRQSGFFEVTDTHADPRFCNHPFVVETPNLRFYAGVSVLSADGYPLGALCVLDVVPRQLDEVQRGALEKFATIVGALLDGSGRSGMKSAPGTMRPTRKQTSRVSAVG